MGDVRIILVTVAYTIPLVWHYSPVWSKVKVQGKSIHLINYVRHYNEMSGSFTPRLLYSHGNSPGIHCIRDLVDTTAGLDLM
jgi:hypothetical protein